MPDVSRADGSTNNSFAASLLTSCYAVVPYLRAVKRGAISFWVCFSSVIRKFYLPEAQLTFSLIALPCFAAFLIKLEFREITPIWILWMDGNDGKRANPFRVSKPGLYSPSYQTFRYLLQQCAIGNNTCWAPGRQTGISGKTNLHCSMSGVQEDVCQQLGFIKKAVTAYPTGKLNRFSSFWILGDFSDALIKRFQAPIHFFVNVVIKCII